MHYIRHYQSPLGPMVLAADDTGLTGAWFEGHKYFGRGLGQTCHREDLPVFQQAAKWLDLYFSGIQPDFSPPVHLAGTAFQLRVWALLREIPYGQTLTYGELARALGCKSAQAVGGAVGRNPLSVFIPCHRCLGAKGQLTGYAGGLERKSALLKLEQDGHM